MTTHTEHVSDPKAEARKYLLTLVSLLILTVITVGASYIQFGSANVVIALTIATIKAIIVALIFMHLLHDKPVNAVIAVAGFIFLGIFLLFDFLDIGSRSDPQPINFHPLPTATQPATDGAPAAGGAAGAAAPGTGGAPAAAAPAGSPAATPAPAKKE
jgi:cytochrome c oxidase subunit 4